MISTNNSLCFLKRQGTKENPETCHSSSPTHLSHSLTGVTRCARSRCCQSPFVSESILGYFRRQFLCRNDKFPELLQGTDSEKNKSELVSVPKTSAVFLLASHYLAELMPTYLGWGWVGRVGKNCLQVGSVYSPE